MVWRVTEDEAGGYRVEVAEVWAVGYRKDKEVYAEIKHRADAAGASPMTKTLSEVLAIFTRQFRDLTATPEPEEPQAVPKWLKDALTYVVGMPEDVVDALTLEQAEQVWNDHITGPGSLP